MSLPRKSFLAPLAFVAAFTQIHIANSADCQQIMTLESFVSTEVAPSGATCSTFLNQNAKTGVSCYWEFSYRDVAASDFAATLWSELKSCRTGSKSGPDLQVNHPDSYDLREWNAEGGVYRVSVKDKGQIQKTLVFLRYR